MRTLAGAFRLLPLPLRVAALSLGTRIVGIFTFDATARRNLKHSFGNELTSALRSKIRRANARAIGRLIAELIDYERRGAETARKLVFLDETLQFLDDALRAGRGAVVVTPHFGNWELFPAHLVQRGYRGAVVGRTPANPYFAKALRDMRARAGVETLDALGSPRAIVRVLHEGGIVGLLPDLDSKRAAGIFVNFLGRPAWTPTGPAHLAVMAGAPVVPAYMILEGDRYRLTFEPAIWPDADASRREEIARLTHAWSERFEARIRAHPENWVWMHDRWATTPEKAEERRRRRNTRTVSREAQAP